MVLWWLSIYTVRVSCFVVYGASRSNIRPHNSEAYHIWLMVIFSVVDSDRLEPDVC